MPDVHTDHSGSAASHASGPRTVDNPDAGLDELVGALAALYAHVYAVPVESVRAAARHRAGAMRISDAWVAAGCDPASPDIAAERDELIQGYRILRKAVSGS